MSAPTASRHAARDQRALTVVVLSVAAGAWLLLAWPAGGLSHRHTTAPSPEPGMAGMDHHMVGHDLGLTTGAVVLILLGWAVMVVAMMLPPALPLLSTLRTLVERRRDAALLVVLGATAFVGVWVVAGGLMIGVDVALRVVRDSSPWLAERPFLIAGVVLLAAGAYQLSPLTDRCLRACRTPRSFVVAYWRGRRAAWRETMTLTSAYAVSCVGCCWALMAVSFVVGVAALPVMVALAVIMTAQRLLPHGRRLVRPVGVATLALGVLAVLDLVPHGLLAA